uniref:GDT1 family protein n=1 Tax=Psilocybe cubensis TaxID=181762 RepID=A0A8H7XN19_PSICU
MDSTPLPLPTDVSSLQALAQSFAMIIVSEIGDKTFLIAAILAMRHPRMPVFLGAFLSLLLIGRPAALFGVFGVKMWQEARAMEGGGQGKIEEEMREAEEEIEDDEREHEGTAKSADIPLESMEEGRRSQDTVPSSPSPSSKKPKSSLAEGARNFCSLFLGPVFVQAFVLTFLGEWGDRSQIATIALGAAHNVYLVTLGTVVGHSCCTALAVIGGRYVSTKISVKHVTYGGSLLFLLFGAVYLYEGFVASAPSDIAMAIPMPVDVNIDDIDIKPS